jgi:predicted dehydrogenase
MKKLFQSLSDGSSAIVEVTPPIARANHVVVASICSLVSTGTERMLVEFGKASLLGKARQQPERVRMVLDKARTDGISKTYDAVKSKLEKSIELGYSNVGVVTEVGPGVKKFRVGDRVVSNGCHAEMVLVPENLCAKIPDSVDSLDAAFTVVASIGLQGIRLANPTMGETVAVFGVGLIGLLTVQLLKAQGCKVLAVDIESGRLELAQQFGAEVCNSAIADPVKIAEAMTDKNGVDAVIIAAASDSDAIVSHAAQMSRKRGRIVLVGVTGLNLNRSDFYEKELSFQVSCSYGAGRYDPSYEEKGNDYPIGYVRWTEQRNFETVLSLMDSRSLNTTSLLTARFPFKNAADAYDRLVSDRECLGLVLDYDFQENADSSSHSVNTIKLHEKDTHSGKTDKINVALLGYGNYASSVLAPAFASNGADLHTVVSASATSIPANTFRFQSNSVAETLDNDEVNLVAITTRHADHAGQVIAALKADKHVFVEKPLCLTLEELGQLEQAYQDANTMLMVGFNRRFAPLVVKAKALLDGLTVPKAMTMAVNAGEIPEDHWIQDLDQGGGRIIGEACHFIDLLRFLVGAEIIGSSISYMDTKTRDTAVICLKFSDGSVGNINYFANGHPSLPKERLEVFAAGRFVRIDNFRKLELYGWPGMRKTHRMSQDKGQRQCVNETLRAIESDGMSPIPIEEIFEVARIAIEFVQGQRHAKGLCD